MKLIYKEDPKEWRKSVLLTVLAVVVISGLLRWRKVIPANTWYIVFAVLGIVALAAMLKPRWFRCYYRVSLRWGFASSQFVGRCVLAALFIFIMTPLGWVFRLAGKDPLQLKRPCGATSYWHQAKDSGPLDRLF
jgi:Saxitoxin biosynthesis operon protein SxtJ